MSSHESSDEWNERQAKNLALEQCDRDNPLIRVGKPRDILDILREGSDRKLYPNWHGICKAAADEIERLRQHVRALEIEIERYRIQCVHVMDLQRLLEVQDKQLECAQKALQILEAANGRDAAPEGCDRGARGVSGALRPGDAG